MITYFLIPARSGSKGIPNKNIKLFGNKPLIQWSIDQSKKSKYFGRVFVSTDSEEYRQLSIKYGAEAPFIRPKEISQDLSTDYEFIKHFINYLQNNNIKIPDLIVQMRPTYPTRKIEIIDKIIEKFIENFDNYDSIRTVIENEKSPYKMYNITGDELIPLFNEVNNIKEPFNQCRQILPKTYLHNGYLDIIKTKTFLEKDSITGDKILSYIMNKDEIDDLDTIEQWIEAENKINSNKIYEQIKLLKLINDDLDINLYNIGTRDNENLKVFITKNDVIFIKDKLIENYYEKKNNLEYWKSNNINDAHLMTYNDDFRRFHLLKNIMPNENNDKINLLDFGCGNGGLIKLLRNEYKKNFLKLYGIDLQIENIKKFFADDNIIFENDINKIPDDSIDILSCFHVLEHLEDHIYYLNLFKKKIKKNGIIIIEVPHARDFLLKEIKLESFKKFTLWSEHLILHTQESLSRFLEYSGLIIKKIEGIQRYEHTNHLNWIINNKPNGHNTLKYLFDNEYNNSYIEYLKKIDRTDTLLVYCTK